LGQKPTLQQRGTGLLSAKSGHWIVVTAISNCSLKSSS
jgi:hypothetical protein